MGQGSPCQPKIQDRTAAATGELIIAEERRLMRWANNWRVQVAARTLHTHTHHSDASLVVTSHQLAANHRILQWRKRNDVMEVVGGNASHTYIRYTCIKFAVFWRQRGADYYLILYGHTVSLPRDALLSAVYAVVVCLCVCVCVCHTPVLYQNP